MKSFVRFIAFFAAMTGTGVALAQATTYVSMVPARLLDTRLGNTTIDGLFAGGGPIAAHSTFNFTVVGRDGIPSSGVGAIALNVTVTNPAAPGFLVAWPAGITQPTASNLNFVANQSVSNQIIVQVGAGGQVSLFVNASTNVVADVAGYFLTTAAYTPLTPTRLLDTRGSGRPTCDGQSNGPSVAAGGTLDVTVLGRCGTPATATALVLNVTATNTHASGYITAWPKGSARPNASNLNFISGQTIPNLVIVGPGAGGLVSLYNSAGTTDLIADVVGYFPSTVDFAPVLPAPVRVMDTRGATWPTCDTQFNGPSIASGGTLNLTVLGRCGVPATGVGAVALNVTATNTAGIGTGYLTVWPTAVGSPPTAMHVNFVDGQTMQSLVIAKVGTNGQVSITNNNGGSTDLVVDVQGWFPTPTISSGCDVTLSPGSNIQASLDTSTIKDVCLSPGSYYPSSMLVVPPGKILEGSSSDMDAVKIISSVGGTVVYLQDNSVLKNLNVDGQPNVTPTSGYGIQAYRITGAIIWNVRAQNNYINVDIGESNTIHLWNVFTSNSGDPNNGAAEPNIWINSTNGIDMQYGEAAGRGDGPNSDGEIAIYGSTNVTISGTHVTNSGASGIYIVGCTTCSVSNAVIVNTSGGWGLDLSQVVNSVFSNNSINSSLYGAAQIAASNNSQIINNSMYSNNFDNLPYIPCQGVNNTTIYNTVTGQSTINSNNTYSGNVGNGILLCDYTYMYTP